MVPLYQSLLLIDPFVWLFVLLLCLVIIIIIIIVVYMLSFTTYMRSLNEILSTKYCNI